MLLYMNVIYIDYNGDFILINDGVIIILVYDGVSLY